MQRAEATSRRARVRRRSEAGAAAAEPDQAAAQDQQGRPTSPPGSSSSSSTATGPGATFGGGLRDPHDARPRATSRRPSRRSRASPASARARRWSRSTTRPAACARWSAEPTSRRRRSTSPPRATASRAPHSSRSPSSRRSRRASRPADVLVPAKKTITGPRGQFKVENYEDRYSGVASLAAATDGLGQLRLRRGRIQARRHEDGCPDGASGWGSGRRSPGTRRWCSAGCASA